MRMLRKVLSWEVAWMAWMKILLYVNEAVSRRRLDCRFNMRTVVSLAWSS